MHARTLTAGVLAAVVLPLAGCSTPGSSAGSGISRNTLVVSTPTEPDILDPTLANNFAARLVFTSFCQKLYDVDSRLHIVPQLAAGLPKVSADGRSVDIPLRTGVRFNDGTSFDAAAVKATLDRDRTMEGSARVNELAAVQRVVVKDPATVHIDLKRPFAPLAAQLADRAGLMMSPAAIRKLGADFGTAPVCVGPFRFKERVSGTEMSFVKSPYYYDRDKVKLDGIVYRFINNSGVATANLESGDLQAAEHLDTSDALKLRDESGFRVLQSNTIAYQSIWFNVRPGAHTALSASPELRKAFEMSINRKALITAVWNDQEVPDCQPLPVQSPLHSGISCTPFDPDGARRLIERSGVHTPVPVEMMVLSGTAAQREAQVIQSMANDVGFKVSVRTLDQVSALELARSGKFDAFIEGWSGRVDPDGNTNDILTTGGSNNFAGNSYRDVDTLVKQAAATNDQARRRDLYARVIKRIAAQRPLIYLYHNRWFTGTSDRVHGVRYGPDALPRFDTAWLSS